MGQYDDGQGINWSDPQFIVSAGPEDLGGSWIGPRWSLNAARPPAWLQGFDPAVINWYHDHVYDQPGIDVGASIAKIEEDFIREAARLGIRADETTGNNLYNAAALELGLISWDTIGGIAGSAPTSGGGPSYLTARDAAIQRAIAEYRAAYPGAPNDDAQVIALIEATNFTEIDRPIVDTKLQGVIVNNPLPMPDQREIDAYNQMGAGGAITYGQTPFLAPTPYPPDMRAPMIMGGNGSMTTWIVLGAIAVAAFLLLRK